MRSAQSATSFCGASFSLRRASARPKIQYCRSCTYMCLPDSHLQKTEPCRRPPVCYRSNVETTFQTGHGMNSKGHPHMPANKDLNYKLALFFQVRILASCQPYPPPIPMPPFKREDRNFARSAHMAPQEELNYKLALFFEFAFWPPANPPAAPKPDARTRWKIIGWNLEPALPRRLFANQKPE